MENNQLLLQLNACATVSNSCFNDCLNEKDFTMLARCVELARECSEICQLTSSFISRDSENVDKLLKLCFEICNTCEEECEKHDYEFCQRCARVCKRCSEMCSEYQMDILKES